MRRGRAIAAVAAGAAALFLLWDCGGSYSSPEGTVRSWLDALEARDTAKVGEAFTDRTRELVAEVERLSRPIAAESGHPAITIEDWCQAFCGATVEGSTFHGDSATVRIRIEDDVNELPLVRRGDEWKIDLSSKLEPAVQMLRLAAPRSPAGEADGGATSPDTAAAADPLP